METLSEKHRAGLEIGSEISSDIIVEQGSFIADFQSRPGLMIPVRETTAERRNAVRMQRTARHVLKGTDMSSVANAGQDLRAEPELIQAALEAVKHPEYPIELRVLGLRNEGTCKFYGRTYNGFYDDLDVAVRDVSNITGRDASGVYMTINPLDPIVRNWNHNRLSRAVKAADDEHVVRLRHLYLDIDPRRPPHTNATEVEHALAVQTLRDVIADLDGIGWPEPILAGSSGSGAMALWRIDLPRSESASIEHVLSALAATFNTDYVSIDTGVANAARIVRVPGTVNAKAPTPQRDRPWALATATVGGGS